MKKMKKKKTLFMGILNSAIKEKWQRGMPMTGLCLAWGEAGTPLF